MLDERTELEREWLSLTRDLLPGLAKERRWPIVNDHCFQRVLLDNACGGVWYDHVPRRPAYRHIEMTVLVRAVALGRACAEGREDLSCLNAESLRWRRARRGQ